MTRNGILLAAIAAACAGTSAIAADLPARKEATALAPYMSPAPVSTWSGFYVGLQAGGVWDRVSNAGDNGNMYYWLLAPGSPLLATLPASFYAYGTNTKSGFVGGGHVGYNLQSGPAVFGLEGDLEGASVWSGSLRGSLRGRVGLAADRALFYVTGGAAFGGRNGSASYGAMGHNFGGDTTSTRLGWTVGAGVDYLFAPNWSAGLEYRYSDFGSSNTYGVYGWNIGGNANLTEHALRARVSYHFNAPVAPVLAKY